jgi:hypothetical protein
MEKRKLSWTCREANLDSSVVQPVARSVFLLSYFGLSEMVALPVVIYIPTMVRSLYRNVWSRHSTAVAKENHGGLQFKIEYATGMVLITLQCIELCAKKNMHQHLHGVHKHFSREFGSIQMALPSNSDVAISIVSRRIWGYHGGSYEEFCLLGYDAV